jgi:hypothetical protein
MKRALYALGSLALGWLIANGCAPDSRPDLSSQIKVTSAEVKDWTNPDDGKTYLVVAPSWKNEGPEAVREVTLLVSKLKGTKGEYPPHIDTYDEKSTTHEQPWIAYKGDPVEAGSTMNPSDAKETFAVMGLKDEVIAKTGESPEASVEVANAFAEVRKDEGTEDKDKP